MKKVTYFGAFLSLVDAGCDFKKGFYEQSHNIYTLLWKYGHQVGYRSKDDGREYERKFFELLKKRFADFI